MYLISFSNIRSSMNKLIVKTTQHLRVIDQKLRHPDTSGHVALSTEGQQIALSTQYVFSGFQPLLQASLGCKVCADVKDECRPP